MQGITPNASKQNADPWARIYWGTRPRSPLSTEFVLPVPTWARFLGRLSRSNDHASSIRTSLDKARNKADGPPGSCSRSLERPTLPVPRCTLHPERKTPPLRRGSALKLLELLQAPPRSSDMRNSSPRGSPSCFRMVVPHTSCLGNEFGLLCAGFIWPGPGSSRRSGRGPCGYRSRSLQPGLGRVGPARQRGGRMAPLRFGTRDHLGAVSGADGTHHGRDASSGSASQGGIYLDTAEMAGSPFPGLIRLTPTPSRSIHRTA